MDLRKVGPSTKAVHAGHGPDKLTGALVPPIYQTSTFAFHSAEHGARLFAGEEEGYIYSRLGNPTVTALAGKIAALEGGEEALITSSGMAAISTAMAALTRARDHIVSTQVIYGATYTFLRDIVSRFGIEVSFVKGASLENIRAALTPSTRLVYIETPANPTLEVIDIAAVAGLTREVGAMLVVDNTFATFYNQHPLALGADLVVYSATKYIGGHGDVIGGAVVGSKELIGQVRRILRNTGGILGPLEAWLLVRGLKTFALRMARHNENGLAVAEFLAGHPRVRCVHYPGLPQFPGHEIARAQMSGFGGMIAFEVEGGVAGGMSLVNAVELCTLAVSLGDVSTLIEHPASMTHAGVPKDVRGGMGITDGLVRLSVGIEDADDIVADLEQALALG
ncbi:MAG: PLP-dependent transferase [Chloroflexi bacterium]|nr:PLP-dependent transferase [Chloroflexota bacterium]